MASEQDREAGTGREPPGARESIWTATTVETAHERVPGEGVEVDTAVVGGGIVGLTTAHRLAEAGRSVALVERDRIAAGVTAHSTAKLTSQHGLIYDHIASEFGEREARRYASANEAAIDHVEARVDALEVDAEFRRLPSYAYVTGADGRSKIRREVDAARRAGLPAEFVEDADLPREAPGAVLFEDQAQFHPRSYLLALARSFLEAGGSIYERTTATDVDVGRRSAGTGRRHTVETDSGSVTADDVVVASHFPFYDHGFYFARLTPKRSYVLAARLDEPAPERLLYRDESPYFSVRPYPGDDESMALVAGQDHRTGTGKDHLERYRNLEREARDAFDIAGIEYRWSTQDFVTVDSVPFVGKLAPQTRNVYVATGFGGWGLTNGVAAGLLLSDLVRGRENDWLDVYDPSRLKPFTSFGELVEHNVHAAKHFLRDRVAGGGGDRSRSRGRGDAGELAPGEARVIEGRTDAVAVYRDEGGEYHAVSAVCTHMGCNVQWNDAERSWDCPCHGSRFDYDGSVLDEPAVEPLPTRDLDRALAALDTGSTNGGRGTDVEVESSRREESSDRRGDDGLEE